MPFAPQQPKSLSREVAAARRHFFAGGWSYRSAAPVLGVTYQYICQVLTGRVQSRRLTAAIRNLPPRQKP